MKPNRNPEPNAANTTISLSFILFCSKASDKAIPTDAAVVFPYL